MNLPTYLEPKYKDDSYDQSIEMSKTFSGSLIDAEIMRISSNNLVNKDSVANQIEEFKKLLFNVADTYIETESAYDLVSNVIHELLKLISGINPTIEGMEDFVIENRRRWREMKEWMGSPSGSLEEESKAWRDISEKMLLELERMENINIGIFLSYYKEVLNTADVEIETLRKTRTINLVFKEGNFHESKGTIKAGDYEAFLSIDEPELKNILVYSRDSSLISKKTALRQANSICKSGFLLSNGRRIGVGCILEESEVTEE